MKMFTAGGEGTGGKRAHRTRRVAVFSLPSSVPSSQVTRTSPPSVPPSCVVARYYRIILGYFTRGASDLVDQRSHLQENDDSFPRILNQPTVFVFAYRNENTDNVHERSVQVRGVHRRLSNIAPDKSKLNRP